MHRLAEKARPCVRWQSRWPAAAMMAVALIAVTFQSTTPSVGEPSIRPAAAAVTVTPSSGLVDRQSVAVSGTGLTPSGKVVVEQCPTGTALAGGCSAYTIVYASTDSAGSFAVSTVVHRMLREPLGTIIDCAVEGACEIAVIDIDAGPPAEITVPLQFDPAVPPIGPTVVVSPDADLVDGQTVTVSGIDFPFSPYPSPPVDIVVLECPTDPTGPSGCIPSPAPSGVVTTDLAGAFTTAITVSRLLTGPTGEVDCTVDGACEITVGYTGDGGTPIRTPIRFRAPTPTTIPSAVAASPAFTG